MSTRSTLTAWERWELASFEPEGGVPPPVTAKTAVSPAPTFSAEEIAALREQARRDGRAEGHAEGYDAGHAEGLAAGLEEAGREGRRVAESLMELVEGLERQLADLDQAVAGELTALSLEIARQVIRDEIAVNPQHLVGLVREALGKLPLQHAAIHLHPDDASLLRLHAGEQLAHAGHRIHEDSKLGRGDVVIESGGSHLDATVATRWRRVVDTLGHDAPWVEEKRR